VTADEHGGVSRVSYEQIAAGAAQLAHALRAVGVDGDDRVGTYLWNNREHLEAYLAVPAMGAVLHTANIRLFADELVQTVSLAQDRVLLADADLLPALSSSDRGLIVVPMFHANAWGYPHAIFWCGGDLILPHRFLKPDQLVPLMEAERPTFVNGVPTIWIDVLRYLREHPDADVSSITRIVVGGSATPRALMQAFRDEYDIPLTQGWGMTETSPLVTLARPRRGQVGEAALEDALSQGRVLAGVELRLVHPETGAPVPSDGRSIGELELRGPWITASYLSGPDPDKFHDGWLRTGDIGTLDPDGYVRLTDRAKDAVKSGGEWISSIGLEAEVAAHPEVIEAACPGAAATEQCG